MPFKPGNYRGTDVRPEVTLRMRYLWFFKFAYGRRAKRKGLEISITEDQFIELVTSDCHYCGKSWQTEQRMVNGFYINMATVDRKSPKAGYTPANCVPCCKRCNTIKMDAEYEEFLLHLKTIISHMVA